jgi:predicted ATPase/DNA-binding SARP family transcriptional activator
VAKIKILLLGALQVIVDNEPVDSLMSDKSRALLTYLAVESHRSHRRDHLAGMLWPNQPDKKSLHNLRQALSSLRKILQDDDHENKFFLVTRDSIQFNPNSNYELDVNNFDDLINKASKFYKRDDKASRIHFRSLNQAVNLYKGHFLDQFFLKEGFYFEEWSTLQREILSRKVLEALNILVEYYERKGDYYQALRCASRMVELAPWEENAHRIVMLQLALNSQWSAAADQYHSLTRYLKDEMGLEPTAETVQLFEEIRSINAKGETIQPRFTPTIDQLPTFTTPFIGRQHELNEIADLLVDPHCRLLTIIGPGGIGKTRLAIEAAREQIASFRNGVYFVSLGDIHNEIHIIPSIANAVDYNFPGQGTLKSQFLRFIRNKKMLLVLDNYEHLLEHTSIISDLLISSPGFVIIATTRERLRLQEEWLFPLAGLSYPNKGKNVWDLNEFDALTLFQVCAQKAGRDYKIPASDVPSIIHICQLVEGIPLAVELAAALTYTKSCQDIAAQLSKNFEILSTSMRNVQSRQRSMLATMQYSWNLLSIEEKHSFSQLSIFLEDFDSEAANTIIGVESSMLTTLINKSLIRNTSEGRYVLHRLLRQFAAEKLSKDESLRRSLEEKFCDYYVNFLSEQAPKLDGKDQLEALIRINQNIDNVRKAWVLLISHEEFSDIDQIVDSIYRFHSIRSLFSECIELFKMALSALADTHNQESLNNRILARQGVLYQRLGKYGIAKKYLEQGLTTFRCYGESKEILFCLAQLGHTYIKTGNYKDVQPIAEEALDLAIDLEDQWGITSSYYLSGYAVYRLGNIKQGKEYLEKSLYISRKSDRPRLSLSPLNALGDIACHQGDYTKAIQIYEECIELSKALGDEYRAGIHFNNLGTVYHILEAYHEAESYYLESLHYCEKIGDLAGQAIALSNLGEIELTRKEFSESRRLFIEGLQIGRDLDDHWTILACLKNLGSISLIQGKLMDAKAIYAEAFEIGTKFETKPLVLNILMDLAEYISINGNPDLAFEMLTYVSSHPSSEQSTREKANQILENYARGTNDIDPRPIEILIENGLNEISE